MQQYEANRWWELELILKEQEVVRIGYLIPNAHFSEGLRAKFMLRNRDGDPSIDADGKEIPEAIMDEDPDLLERYGAYLNRHVRRHIWITSKLEIKLWGKWEGIEFEEDVPLSSAEKAKWIDFYHLYACAIGQRLESMCLYGPEISQKRVITIDEIEQMVGKALMSGKSQKEFKENITFLIEELKRTGIFTPPDGDIKKLKADLHKKDKAKDPTPPAA